MKTLLQLVIIIVSCSIGAITTYLGIQYFNQRSVIKEGYQGTAFVISVKMAADQKKETNFVYARDQQGQSLQFLIPGSQIGLAPIGAFPVLNQLVEGDEIEFFGTLLRKNVDGWTINNVILGDPKHYIREIE